MRIFVSSSFEDLKEHRAGAIRVLRQLGHEVLAMEEMIAGSVAPLAKVLEMVDRSEAYVGIFAWRYGYLPPAVDPPAPGKIAVPVVVGAATGQTSITHYEYLRAVQRELPVIALLLDEHYPWPPQFIDGFDTSRADAPKNSDRIRELRQVLQQERVVSWFTTPADLEARVGAAVTMAGLTRQLDLRTATALDPAAGVANSDAEYGITKAIIAAGDQRHALKIDLATTWWSTRLYLIASLAQRLTQARRILVVDSSPDAAGKVEERFVGQLSTSAVLSTLCPKVSALGIFAERLQQRLMEYSEVHSEIRVLLDKWATAFGDDAGGHAHEESSKVDLTAELLRRWFGDAMLQQAVYIADLRRASIVDLLRLLDYPNEYVPVLTQWASDEDQAGTERVNVVDKSALNARLARSYLGELMDRARLA